MRIPGLLVTLSLLLFAPSLFAQSPSYPQGNARVTVVRSDAGGVVLRVTGLRPVVRRSGATMSVEHNAALYLARADSLSLPSLSFTVAVPHGADRFNAVASDVGSMSMPLDAPASTVRSRTGVRVGPLHTIRGIAAVTVIYDPLRLAGATLSVDTAVTITLRWTAPRTPAEARKDAVEESPGIDQALRGLIVNYDQSAPWRRRNGPSPMRLHSGAIGWGIGEAMVLLVPRDGIYRISASELMASGATSIGGVALSSLGLQHRGSTRPIFVSDADGDGRFNGSDFVELEGKRNRYYEKDPFYRDSSARDYYDMVSDTNAYILSWDGRLGEPARVSSSMLPADAAPMRAYDSTLHFEREEDFVEGVNMPDDTAWGGDIRTLHVSERAWGERFYWSVLDGEGRWLESYAFDCAPVLEPNATYLLRVRLTNAAGYATPIQLWLNEFGAAGSYVLPPRSDTAIEVEVGANLLVNGPNTLSLVIEQGQGVLYRVLVDYFELTGRWRTSTNDASPRFTVPASAQPGQPVRVRLNGLRAPVTHALSERSRVVADSSEIPGLHFRVTSRTFYFGRERQNRGFIAEFGDTLRSDVSFLGLVISEVDGSGRILRKDQFRTFDSDGAVAASELSRATTFLDAIASGNFVVAGTSLGFGFAPLTQEFSRALTALGSAVPSQGSHLYAAWAFVARKGEPATAREEFAVMTGPESRGVTLDEWLPSPQGNRYRAVFTVAGMPGEEFILGSPQRPATRYHATDELLSSSNEADLIIITHPAFRAAAERLATHRRANAPDDDAAFTVRVVDVHTIYDEFGWGIKHQNPIRAFLQYADSNWTAPGPGYVLLFGDASSDPERRDIKSSMIDYVPTLGEPASDYWYTMPYVGHDSARLDRWPHDPGSSWNQLIGRLPAMSPSDAAVMVDKIVEYDTAAPAWWNKRVVFIAGGADESEVRQNIAFAESIGGEYVAGSFFQGDTTIRFRRTFPGIPSKPPHPDALWAQEAMAQGGVWVNAAGHGSRTVLDLDFGMPEEIDNDERYFVLGTFSCQTGAFSESESSLRNEDFIKAPRRGAIATYGSTGWSFKHLNDGTVANIFSLITLENVRSLGALTTLAKYRMFTGYESTWWHGGYLGFMARNHLMQYSLLGDPSQQIKVSRHRELAFESAAVSSVTGGALSIRDTVALVRVELHNYGRPINAFDADVDSTITVVGTIVGPDRSERQDTFVVRWLARSQTVELELPLEGITGEYTVRIEADPEKQVDEGYREDNVLVMTFRIRGNQPLPLEPVSYGRVGGYDDVVIRLLNPPSGGGADITVDTVPSFDSPAAFTSAATGSMTSDDMTTTWTFSIPQGLRGASRFWWRAIAAAGEKDTLVETFTVSAASTADFMLGGRDQMAGHVQSLVNDDVGVGPGSRRARLIVWAIGQSRYPNDEPIAQIRKISFVVDDGTGSTRSLADDNRAGLHIAVLDPATLELLPGFYQQFLFFENAPMIDSAARFIASIPTGHPVIVATSGRAFDGVREHETLRAALATLGATLVADSVGVMDSYVLIGGKGMGTPARQAWVYGDSLARARAVSPRYAVANAEKEYSIDPTPGTMTTPTIGPATSWRSARLELGERGIAPQVTVVGVRRDGVRDSLATQPGSATIDLGFVDVDRYPRIELRARFAADSTTRLRAVSVDFTPSPELAVIPRSVDIDRDSVLQGDPAGLSLRVVNLSRRQSADSVEVALQHRSLGEWRRIDEMRLSLAPLERRDVRFELITDRYGASNWFTVELNPQDVPSEPYRHNNNDTATMRAGRDTAGPRLAVYADGERVMDGDFVSPTARFEIRLFDNSRLRISDSSSIGMFLDLVEITLDSGARFEVAPGGDVRASFMYTPPQPGLGDGEHTITYLARDASGNRSESEFVRFFVERALRVVEAVNYPNPFRDRTEFTFRVAGGSQPTNGEIAIFTVAGRKIKSIRLGPTDLHLGFNHIEWDGLDEDRDPIANGTYLYRITVESADGRVDVIEKLVVMR